MFTKLFAAIAVLIALSLPVSAYAGNYEMDNEGAQGALTIPVTVNVISQEEIFDSRSCYTDHPAEECVFMTDEQVAMIKTIDGATINSMN